MAVPARYRQSIEAASEGRLIATIDTEESCLLVYPASDWEDIEAQIDRLPSLDPVARRIKRLLIGHATEVDMDKSGRILVPPLLRDLVGIDRKAMIVGQRKKFELWSEDTWTATRDRYLEEAGSNPALSEQLSSLSL
jgi:MraZ protein